MMGKIYLIHAYGRIGNLENPYGCANHYMGYTNRSLKARMKEHEAATGQGAHIMAAFKKAGIAWEVVRTWTGNKALERQLKNQKNLPRLCPVCRKEALARMAANQRKRYNDHKFAEFFLFYLLTREAWDE